MIAGIFWGTSGIFSTYLKQYGLSGMEATLVRGGVSLLFMLVYALIFDRRAFRITLSELALFAGLGVALFGSGTAYFYAIPMTSNATAVVLMYTAPVIVAVFSAIFFGEQFSGLKLLSVGLMLFGCVLVSGVIGDLRVSALGIFLGLLSGVSYAAYNIVTKIAMQRGSSPMSATLYGVAFMTLFSLVFSKPAAIGSAVVQTPFPVLPLIVGIGLFTFVIPYLLYTTAMKTLPAGTACALSIIEPMSATVYSMILFGDVPSVPSAIGIVLILLAVFLLSRTQNTKKKDKKS